MNKIKTIFSYISCSIILYLFIFDPHILMFRGRLSFSNIIAFVCFVYSFINFKILYSFWKLFKTEYFLGGLIVLYTVFRTLVGGDSGYISTHFLLFVRLFIVIPFLFYLFSKLEGRVEDNIVRILLIVGSVASLISLVCLLSPDINAYIKDSIIQYDEDDYLFDNEYRGFGLAGMLTSNFGYVQGFIACFGLFYLKDNKWFLPFILLIILSSLINARTGALIAFVGIVIWVFSNKSFFSYIFVLITILAILNIENILLLMGVNDKTLFWILSFMGEVTDVMSAGDVVSSTTAQSLFGYMIVWPENFEQWILGRGYSIFLDNIANSDMGWIIQLNYGGLVYVAGLYYLVFYMIKRLFHNGAKWYAFLFTATFIIANTKGCVFPGFSLFYVLTMIYYINIIKGHNKKIKYENRSVSYSI